MDTEFIRKKKQEIEERYGEWTAHNIQLTGDIYTIDNRITGDEIKLRRILQILSDISCPPIEKLRILDLACLEGLYAIELARHGAQVVAIEGREANIEKARFVKKVLYLDNLELYQDNVCNISKEKYGYFDIVLCLGILYHLDTPDIFKFVERISEVCRLFAVIDTHISVTGNEYFVFNNKKYRGKYYEEHKSDSTPEERLKSVWSSIDNQKSFWLTRSSLLNLLSHVGFTSVYECHNPPEIMKPPDRLTLLAVKGDRKKLSVSPLVNSLPQDEWPESPEGDSV